MSKGLLDDIPIYNKARDKAWEKFIKRKDVKHLVTHGLFDKGFPLYGGYYELWCQAWSRAWDSGFNDGCNDISQERVDETAKLRHDVLEEVAKEFDKMPFGDTAASFAIFVRNMKARND